LNFHGRGLSVKLSAFPGVNLLTSLRGDTELFGGSAILPRKVLNVTEEGYGYLNLRNRDL